MIQAKDIMTKELITVSPKTEITKAAEILLEKGSMGFRSWTQDGLWDPLPE